MITFAITGVDGAVRALGRAATQVPLAARAALEEGAQVVESHMKDLSEAGRPGPIGHSHDNRDSIEIHAGLGAAGAVMEASGMSIQIGPTSRYGRRLELGYHGTDSLGRHYDTEPFPFVEPARDAAEDEVFSIMEAAYEAALTAALGGF